MLGEQVEQGRSDQAAQDGDGHRVQDLIPGHIAGDRQGQEGQAGDQRDRDPEREGGRGAVDLLFRIGGVPYALEHTQIAPSDTDGESSSTAHRWNNYLGVTLRAGERILLDSVSYFQPRFDDFAVPFEPGMSVLDALIWIRANVDPSLAIRYSCTNANTCKECMVRLDGKTVYACTARLQEREMAYATGRCMCHAELRIPFEVDDVVAMVRKVYDGRVVFHDGDDQIAPGITCLHPRSALGRKRKAVAKIKIPTAMPVGTVARVAPR